MQEQLIKTGFHRIGLILAIPFAAAAVVMTACALYTWITTSGPDVLVQSRTACAGCSAVFGALLYAVTWAVGWVVNLVSG